MITSYPLQSNYLGNDEYGNPLFDRAVDSIWFRRFWSIFYSNGVQIPPANSFQVLAISGLTLSVKLGNCCINGLISQSDEDVNITLEAAGTTERTDLIVIRADYEINRTVTVNVLKGKSNVSDLTRNTNVWELAIAKVLVRANTLSISQADITDLRLDKEFCGAMNNQLPTVDMTPIFNQFQSYLNQKITEWNQIQTTQQNTWSSQTAKQQTDWNTQTTSQQNTWQDWFNSAKINLKTYASFDFENISMLPGTVKSTAFTSSTEINETIKRKADNFILATRRTVFNANETITLTEKVYAPDNGALLNQSVTTTTFNADGSITEEVV